MLVGLCVSGGVRLAVEGLGQVQKAASRPFTELVVGADQVQRLLPGEHFATLARAVAGQLPTISVGKAIIEVANRDLEGLRQLPEPRSRNAVGAALVLLDLLKADPDRTSQLLLGEAEKPAAAAQTLAEMNVDIVSHSRDPL